MSNDWGTIKIGELMKFNEKLIVQWHKTHSTKMHGWARAMDIIDIKFDMT